MANSKTPTTRKSIDSNTFKHKGSRGVKFEIARCDLDGVLEITAPKSMAEEIIMLDLCEMMTWHTLNIVPRLFNGQSGYVKGIKIKRV
jgi:hypothetical protein